MEIIAEILLGLFQLLGELIAQSACELLAEVGLRSLGEPFACVKPINPIFAGIGYFLYGAIGGGLSLLLPKLFTIPGWARLLNLILTPLACGFIMLLVRAIRRRRGDSLIRLDTFLYGYLFALGMAAVRFIWR